MSPFRSAAAVGAATLASLVLAVPPGWADDLPAPLRECATHSEVSAGYSPAELRAALAAIPTDVDEYTDCRDQLDAALTAALGPSHRTAATATPGSGAAPAAGAPAGGAGGGNRADLAELSAAVASTTPTTPTPAPTATPDPTDTGATSPEVRPLGQPAGSLAAAGIVGASLLALGRPAMLRRRRDQGE